MSEYILRLQIQELAVHQFEFRQNRSHVDTNPNLILTEMTTTLLTFLYQMILFRCHSLHPYHTDG